jgi:hypothetical protein
MTFRRPVGRLRLFAWLSTGVALVAMCAPAAMRAQSSDTLAMRELAPGVAYRHFVDARGPWSVHLVRVDLTRADLEVRHVRALGALRGREKTSEMARRAGTDKGTRVLAAVNADFFDLQTGENENEQVIDGEWWKGLKVTDSPYDTFDNPHVQLGIDSARRPLIDRFILDGKAWAHGAATPILTVNRAPTGAYEGTTLYTPRYGAATPRDTTHKFVEVAMVAAGHRGDTLLFLRRGAPTTTAGTPIPADGVVLSAFGARTAEVHAMADGDTVRVLLATLPRMPHGSVPRMLVGGWPRLLRDGELVAADAASLEGTISRNAEMRHPRTAAGFSRDSSTLLLLTVDGRSENSGGMTLVELGRMMRQLSAWQAMNFDGGGSTTMVVDGMVVNHPSDSTGERAVGNAVVVMRRCGGSAAADGVGVGAGVQHSSAVCSPSLRRRSASPPSQSGSSRAPSYSRHCGLPHGRLRRARAASHHGRPHRATIHAERRRHRRAP